MAKLKPGDPLSAISAREYNRHVDVADWYERTQRLGAVGNAAASGLDGTLVRVKNGTGTDFRQYDPVGLGAPAVTLSDGYMIFAAEAPTNAMQGVWGVAVDPIPDGEMGRVRMAGVAAAYVTLADTVWRPYAAVSGTVLVPAWYGAAEIAYSPLATGEKLCAVRLCALQSPTYLGVADASIAAGASGNVSLYYGSADVDTVTAYNDWMDSSTAVNSGIEVLIRYFVDESKWRIIEASCA